MAQSILGIMIFQKSNAGLAAFFSHSVIINFVKYCVLQRGLSLLDLLSFIRQQASDAAQELATSD